MEIKTPPSFYLLFICVVFQTLVEMLTLFSCMCMMASDTLTEIESAASSMLKGPSNFSETWYKASERNGGDTGRDKVCYDCIHLKMFCL